MSKIKYPILRYFGSKFTMKSKIIPHIPKTKHFCSVFVGGGGVEFSLPYFGTSEVWNDLDGEISNFYKVLQNPHMFSEFSKLCLLTPFSEAAFKASQVASEAPFDYFGTSVYRAYSFFIRNRMSRGGTGECFATTSSRLRRNINEQVSAYLSAIDGLEAFHNRIMYVEIRNMGFEECIKKFDREDSFLYLDPPYMKETRVAGGYTHEMGSLEHEDLLKLLENVSGKFMLHCYPSELYTSYAESNSWYSLDFEVVKASSSAKIRPKAIERIYTNYPLDI